MRQASPVHRPGAPMRQSHLAVLVVDDDTLALQGTVAIAREWAISLATARNLAEARHELLVVREAALLVLCDLWLSGQESGLEVLGALRTQWSGNFYGVVVTGDMRDETLRLIQSANYPVLHKPVSPARLKATLTYYLNRAKSDAQGPSQI